MRLWTLHPRYLDARGLVALWREALLAQEVLGGTTKGYQHHPQLARFRTATDSLAAIASYLQGVFEEAQRRGYVFDVRKIPHLRQSKPMNETRGQLLYEWNHLQLKLKLRDLSRYEECLSLRVPAPHPLFRIVAGDVQPWERVR
jgi:Pyrimidine dimer DNA glycosylase